MDITTAALQALQGSYGTTSASSLGNITAGNTAAGGTLDGTAMFKDVLSNVMSSANNTDSVFQADVVKAAAGELDNPQQLLIDASKANVSLQLAVGVRDKALDAYNSILSMQV